MADIQAILKEAKTVAVVGISPKPGRASGEVAAYLKARGYTVVPVNPMYEEVLGLKAYPSLEQIPADIKIDIVDVFRKGEDTPDIAREAVKIKAGCLWLQLGIENDESKRIARDGGLAFVQDKCIKIEHQRHLG